MVDVFLGCTAGDDGTRETTSNCHSHPETGRLVMVTGSDLAREPGWLRAMRKRRRRSSKLRDVTG